MVACFYMSAADWAAGRGNRDFEQARRIWAGLMFAQGIVECYFIFLYIRFSNELKKLKSRNDTLVDPIYQQAYVPIQAPQTYVPNQAPHPIQVVYA